MLNLIISIERYQIIEVKESQFNQIKIYFFDILQQNDRF